MKVFIADIFPKIQKFSKKLDQLAVLTSHHWVSLNDINSSKSVLIFRQNNEILFSENGVIEKGFWEYLGNESILLERKKKSFLLKHAFVDEDVLALKLDGSSGYAIFINETKFGREINSIEDVVTFLESKYFKKETPKPNQPVKDPKRKKPTKEPEKPIILQTPNYNESEAKESYDLFNGKFSTITINFDDGLKGDIFLGGKSKRYFLLYGFNGIQYFETKQQCVDRLYKHLHDITKYS